MIDECLGLRRPIIKILHLIEKEKGVLTGSCRLVERMAEHAILKPPGNRENGIWNTLQGGKLIELNPKYTIPCDTGIQEMLYHLKLKRGLTDLPRPPEHKDRRQTTHEPFHRGVKDPPLENRQYLTRFALPPRIGGIQVFRQSGRKPLLVENIPAHTDSSMHAKESPSHPVSIIISFPDTTTFFTSITPDFTSRNGFPALRPTVP